MNIRLYPTLEQVDRPALQDSAVVVIDVLRASTTIVAAIDSGAEKIIPIADVETASRLARPSERDAKLLAGERKGCPIPGFDLCNSPEEFTAEKVRGRTIVFTTTNGTRAIAVAAKARRTIICAMTNVRAVASALAGEREAIVLCCGTEGSVSAEDLLCGGILLASLGDEVASETLTDSARIARIIADRYGPDAETFIRSCDHGRRLIELGFEKDVAFCSRVGVSTSVPIVKGGAIVALV
ncbi:MAG: 2-phosphosulfolactate phosphatase [Candidatus Krumholzibacteria bacterium]|nr:2-phosphosulfolactate phosphatase [Candidatus Krumholzibacteria bacterium]